VKKLLAAVAAALTAACVAGTATGGAAVCPPGTQNPNYCEQPPKPPRTQLVSEGAGPSTRPAIDGAGDLVAFESASQNIGVDPNGAVRDVFLRDLLGGPARLISVSRDGRGGNGPSGSPALDGRGDRVVFASAASNLVAGDANGAGDIFVSNAAGQVSRVSVDGSGREANGPSSQPDIDRAGRYVAFTSQATNLFPDDTNGVADVFVKDLQTGGLTRLAVPAFGAQTDGPSGRPSISSDGTWVSFQSSATNLVAGDTNGVADVFAVRVDGTGLFRASVSSQGAQQNRAVPAPFEQVSDVARDGRFVVFDSDATNLVGRDRNGSTDVFVRDRIRRTTTLVSRDLYLRQGNGDSFAPTITAAGRYVAFRSLAGNLVPNDGPDDDVFVYDRQLQAVSVASVKAGGGPGHEGMVAQPLEPPAISDVGTTVAFGSTAADLVSGEDNEVEDVFSRDLTPIRARFALRPAGTQGRRPRYRMRAAAPGVKYYLCTLNKTRTVCPPAARLPRLARRSYRFQLRPGGPGLLFGPALSTRFRVRG
jgi:Tol biopolymer transport system component